MYYIGTLEEVTAIEAQICVNANLPNGRGTFRWAEPQETITAGVYALTVPVNGWNGCTYEQMTQGISHPETEIVEFPEVDGE